MPQSDDVRGWADVLSQADLAFSLGEAGFMAISPDGFANLLTAYRSDQRIQERYQYLAEAIVRSLREGGQDRPAEPAPGS